MDKRRVPRMTLSLVLSVLAVLTLTVINEVGFRRSTEALEAIDQSLRTRAQLHRLMQLMLDAETGTRGFLLTGEAAYLQPYEAAIADMDRTLQALHALYPPAGEEAGLLAAITADTQRKLAEMALSVRMRQQGREEAWKFVLMSDVGRQHMDAIRAQANRLIGQASARVAQHQAQVRYSLLVARLGIAAVALAALVAFVLYLRQTRRLEAAGERQQRALERERDQLEQLVRERTASLAELATHLQQVREQERGHLARELHDELGALLTAAKLDVARLRSRLGDDAPDTAQRLQHLVETLNRGIALKRRIIEDLRPSSLANLGLAASLEILVRDFGEHTGVEVVTSLEPAPADEARDLTVYRLVQESLTNIAKYAQARTVEVAVRRDGHWLEVTVRDDGVGFEPSRVRPTTHGLAGMRHRVEAAGGRLAVDAAPGQGTRVRALLPLRSVLLQRGGTPADEGTGPAPIRDG